MAMVRKQIYITREQDEKLKRAAARLGTTEADVVRRALERLQDSTGNTDLELALELIEQLRRRTLPHDETLPWSRADIYRDHPRRLDPKAWLEELTAIEERERLLPGGGSTVKWMREDSYDEPRSRFPG